MEAKDRVLEVRTSVFSLHLLHCECVGRVVLGENIGFFKNYQNIYYFNL